MIEVLITVVILSIGLLGIASLQLVALRSSQSALQNSMATMFTYSMLDSMRANKAAALSGQYDEALLCKAPAGNTLALQDKALWIQSVQAELGGSACGRIACAKDTKSCDVAVTWVDATDKTKAKSSPEVVTRSLL